MISVSVNQTVFSFPFFFAGLEYKFMVKSVDPDATSAITKRKNKLEDAVFSITSDLHEEEKRKKKIYTDTFRELGPSMKLAEEKKLPNSTGKD